MADSKSPVPKRLKEARLATGLSQKKLGIAAGIDEFSASARMNQYEMEKHIPDFLTLKRVGKVLKCPVNYFYTEDDQIADIILIVSNLTKEKKKKVIDFLRTL